MAQVLLSLATHLYAPIYLAKIHNLRNAFQESGNDPLKLVLPKSRQYQSLVQSGQLTEDPIITALRDDPSTIAVVADPARTVLANEELFRDLVICAPIVRRPFLWLARHQNDTPIRYIVSHPKGMTAHRLALRYLEKNGDGGSSDDAQVIETPRPGFEHLTYKAARGELSWLQGRKQYFSSCAYVTADYVQAAARLPCLQNLDDLCAKTVVSALITTRQVMSDPTRRTKLFHLVEGIYTAVELMRRCPAQCAADLMRHEFSYPFFLQVLRTEDRAAASRNLMRFINDANNTNVFYREPEFDRSSWQAMHSEMAWYFAKFPAGRFSETLKNNISAFSRIEQQQL